MKKILVLGAGTAGTMVSNRLNRLLPKGDWQITLVDPDPIHYYQPDFLFVPFGMVTANSAFRNKRKVITSAAELIQSKVVQIDPEHNQVRLENSTTLTYDFLIIATGVDIHPEETPGLAEHEWGKSIHTFYSWEGVLALTEKLRTWKGGRLVVNVVENPIKCPVAPMEFLLLSDWYFTKLGIRDRVEITYATPLSGAFTKPIASQMIGDLLAERNIKVEPDFMIERVDPDAKKIISYDERELEYDLLVSVPLNKGADVVGQSGLGDELNYSPVDPYTSQSKKFANIFVLGDASNIPTSKAGSVAHFSIDTFSENFLHLIHGKPLEPLFDGHANCFIESGYGKGLLIDFNYTQEPLPGRYPMPVLGPFSLLEESYFNHIGKLSFRWIYWNILLKGMKIPLPATMSMAGKRKV
jgi:sulfide:quinone oxidoreductase